jgi:CelD/BcsL family acetyltransferase involved in cellulose biosynthesis
VPDLTAGLISGIDIRIFTDFAEAAPVWRQFEETGTCYVFQSFDWLASWYDEIGRRMDVTPCLVSVKMTAEEHAGKDQLLFLPLGVEKRGITSRIIWLGGTVSDYLGPIIGAGYASFRQNHTFPQLWSHIHRALPQADAVWLQKQPALIENIANPFLELDCVPMPFSAHAVALPGQWAELYAAKTSAKTRAKERRKEKLLSAAGNLVFEHTASLECVEPVMARLIEYKTLKYKQLGAVNIFAAYGIKNFLIGLAKRRGLSFQAHLSFLAIGNHIVAAHWGVEFKGRFYYILPAFDETNFKEVSPGSVLCRRLLQWACERELDVFDFTIGDEPYKIRWTDRTLPLAEFFQPNSFRGRVIVVLEATKRNLKAKVRRSPVLYRRVPALKRALRKLGGVFTS